MEDEHRKVLGREVVHRAVAAVHRELVVVAGHKNLVAGRVFVVMLVGRTVAGLEADHIGLVVLGRGMVIENTATEDMEKKPSVQAAAAGVYYILTAFDMETMLEVVQMETVELLVSQDVEVLEGRPVVEMLEDMGWQPGRGMIDLRCNLRLTFCLREAFVAVK